jgi:hypothetical protein
MAMEKKKQHIHVEGMLDRYALCHTLAAVYHNRRSRYRRVMRALCRVTCIHSLLGFLGFRVFTPMKTVPHGVFRFFLALPPIGWSIGFIARARTVGRIPRCRDVPAFPSLRLAC